MVGCDMVDLPGSWPPPGRRIRAAGHRSPAWSGRRGDVPLEDDERTEPVGIGERLGLTDPAAGPERVDVGGVGPLGPDPPALVDEVVDAEVAQEGRPGSATRSAGWSSWSWSTATSAVMSWVPGASSGWPPRWLARIGAQPAHLRPAANARRWCPVVDDQRADPGEDDGATSATQRRACWLPGHPAIVRRHASAPSAGDGRPAEPVPVRTRAPRRRPRPPPSRRSPRLGVGRCRRAGCRAARWRDAPPVSADGTVGRRGEHGTSVRRGRRRRCGRGDSPSTSPTQPGRCSAWSSRWDALRSTRT